MFVQCNCGRQSNHHLSRVQWKSKASLTGKLKSCIALVQVGTNSKKVYGLELRKVMRNSPIISQHVQAGCLVYDFMTKPPFLPEDC